MHGFFSMVKVACTENWIKQNYRNVQELECSWAASNLVSVKQRGHMDKSGKLQIKAGSTPREASQGKTTMSHALRT